MIFQIFYVTTLGILQIVYGTSNGGRKYRSLGRVKYNENLFRCPREGFHPDARDCRTFYRCVDWTSNDYFRDYTEPQLTAFRFECSEGTVFDPDYNVCTHPRETRRLECGGRGNNHEGYTPPDGSNAQGSQSGQSGYPGQNGYPGSEGLPNESENQIMPSKEGETNQTPLSPSENCQSSGFHPVKGDCQKFLRCVDNGKGGYTKYEFSCGPGTVWDPVNSVCNYPSQVPGCGGSGQQGGQGVQDGYPGQGGSPGPGGYPGQGGSPGQGGYPGPGGYPEQGGYPGQEGKPSQGGYPGQEGKPSQGGYPGQGGSPGQGGYPGPGGYPGQGGYPGPGGNPEQGGYPGQEGKPSQGGYPGQGGTSGPGGYPGQGGSPGQGGYPGPGGYPEQGGYPGQEGKPSQGGYPGQEGKPSQGGYPGPGGYPGQGAYPGPGGYPGQGGYPGPGGNPEQGGYPGQEGKPSQGGYPGPGGYPGQGAYPGQGGTSGQGGYPGQGGSPGQGGYPGQGGSPGQGGYPDSGLPGQEQVTGEPEGGIFSGKCTTSGFYGVPGNCKKFIRCVENGNGGYSKYDFECSPGTAWDIRLNTCNHASMVKGCENSNQNPVEEGGQAGYPGPGMPGQGGYPRPERPGQEGYPRPGMPGQGGYPRPERPGQEGYPRPGMPGQEGYPGPEMPGQGGYPRPERPGQEGYPRPGMPGQEGYPGPEKPGQEGYPGPDNSSENQNPPSGDPSECQNDGFYPVKNNCKAFFRCVSNGKEGFLRYDFQCGEGTLWDQKNEVCNYPWAVARSDSNCSMSSTNQTWSQTTSSTSSSSTFSQSTPYYNTSTTSSQNHFSTSSTTPQTGSSQSQSQSGTTTDSESQTQGSQNPSSQGISQYPGLRPTGQGFTKPMTPQPKPTTENPMLETSSPGEDLSKPPPGSSPCDKNKISSKIKCEKDGFYPDPKDCSKFYRCADWGDKKFSIYYFECGKGTIWDPALETCNHEKSVYPPRDCSGQTDEKNKEPGTNQSTPSATTEANKVSTTIKPASSTPTNATTTKQPITTAQPITTTSASTESSTATQPTTIPSQVTTEMFTSQTSPIDATDVTTSSTDQTDSNTNPTDATAVTESTTSLPTSPTASTDSTESTTKAEGTSEMTIESTANPNEESNESSTVSQMESTTSSTNTEPTESTTPSSNSESTEATESTTSQGSITTETPNGGDPNCPELNADQSAFVCPTGFRRHPKDCNLFYQCTTSKDSGDINIMILSCKNDTMYDERKIQCLPPEETDSCQSQGQGRRVYRRAKDEFSSVVYVSPYKRLCPEEGSFAYEGDCSRFYKCKKDKRGKIQGYLYQCPENYSFQDSIGRCEKSSKISQCTRSIPEVTIKSMKWMRSKVPVEYSI